MSELSPTPHAAESRSPRGAKWLPFLLFTGALVLIWFLRATVFVPIDDAIPSYFASRIYANTVKFAIYVVPVFWYVWFYRKRSPFVWFRLSTRPSPSGLLWAALLVPGYLVASVLVDGLLNWRLPQLSEDPLWLIVVASGSTAFSSFCEEIFCRGFILRELWERTRFWPANLISSLLFTGIHWPTWIRINGIQSSLLIDTVWVFVLGLLLGLLVKLTNSIWPAALLHSLANILIIVLIT